MVAIESQKITCSHTDCNFLKVYNPKPTPYMSYPKHHKETNIGTAAFLHGLASLLVNGSFPGGALYGALTLKFRASHQKIKDPVMRLAQDTVACVGTATILKRLGMEVPSAFVAIPLLVSAFTVVYNGINKMNADSRMNQAHDLYHSLDMRKIIAEMKETSDDQAEKTAELDVEKDVAAEVESEAAKKEIDTQVKETAELDDVNEVAAEAENEEQEDIDTQAEKTVELDVEKEVVTEAESEVTKEEVADLDVETEAVAESESEINEVTEEIETLPEETVKEIAPEAESEVNEISEEETVKTADNEVVLQKEEQDSPDSNMPVDNVTASDKEESKGTSKKLEDSFNLGEEDFFNFFKIDDKAGTVSA